MCPSTQLGYRRLHLHPGMGTVNICSIAEKIVHLQIVIAAGTFCYYHILYELDLASEANLQVVLSSKLKAVHVRVGISNHLATERSFGWYAYKSFLTNDVLTTTSRRPLPRKKLRWRSRVFNAKHR